jgi:GNAT superfamily N-acetyltransferase
VEIRTIAAEQTWPLRHQVMWPGETLDFMKLPDDLLGTHWGVWENDTLVSVVSCFLEGEEMQFRKLATLPAYQGRGYASQLLQQVFSWAKERQVKRIWCNARAEKIEFYQRLGMKATAQRFVRKEKAYVVMEIISC